jgi:hypothetical protein
MTPIILASKPRLDSGSEIGGDRWLNVTMEIHEYWVWIARLSHVVVYRWHRFIK